MGRAQDWAAAVWSAGGLLTTDYEAFIREFWVVFDHPDHGQSSAQKLLCLRQGSMQILVAEHAKPSQLNSSVLLCMHDYKEPSLPTHFKLLPLPMAGHGHCHTLLWTLSWTRPSQRATQ